MYYSLLGVFIISLCVVVRADEKDGVFEKLKSGLQYAKNYLETVKKITDLVSKSLGHPDNRQNNKKRGDDDGAKHRRVPKHPETPNIVSGFFRLFGLDSSKTAAIAVNSVIFLAQMISSLFDIKPKMEEVEGRDDDVLFDPVEFIMRTKNERVQNLLRQAHDPNLPKQLIDRLDGLDSACVKLLMCKSSPIILAAQNSLENQTRSPKFDLTSWLPTKEDFEDNGDTCEEKHPDCQLFPEIT